MVFEEFWHFAARENEAILSGAWPALEWLTSITCPDHVQAQWIYLEGFMVRFAKSYSVLSAYCLESLYWW
jgi:hypothetical protein